MRDEVIDLISRLVAVDSVNPALVPGGAGETEVARFVAAWAESNGLAAEWLEATPGRPSVVVRKRASGGSRTLMLCAHLDTVGVEGMADPHVPRLAGDRLHGRGAYDMKAGLAAVQPVAVDPRDERVGHPVVADGVEVRAQQQRAPAATARRADEHAGAPRRRLEPLRDQARIARPARHERRDLRLARAARHERRVDRVDRDQRAEQRRDVVAHQVNDCSPTAPSSASARASAEPGAAV